MIFECIVTTLNEDGSLQISPMGPEVDRQWSGFELRPFAPSNTLENLDRKRAGVLHVFDTALIFAEAVCGIEISDRESSRADVVDGLILKNSCRAMEFEVVHLDRSENRASIQCRIVKVHEHRPYSGMNRARNAVVEASIAASRIMFIPIESIRQQLDGLERIVQRTGGSDEIKAFGMLQDFIDTRLADART